MGKANAKSCSVLLFRGRLLDDGRSSRGSSTCWLEVRRERANEERGAAVQGGGGIGHLHALPVPRSSPGDRLSDHRVNRPRPVKGAGMNKSLAPSTAPASGSAGAAAGNDGEIAPPPQKKARQDEAGGSN